MTILYFGGYVIAVFLAARAAAQGKWGAFTAYLACMIVLALAAGGSVEALNG